MLPSAPPVRTAEPGTIVAGRYRVVRTLGGGGMGRVYEVLDLGTQKKRALKILHRQLADDPVMVERFLREARALGSLDHPSIVQVHAWGPLDDGSLYIVLELVPGETLDRAMRTRGPMELATFAPIFRDLALGLQYAHERGIVHRDLKPSNVILSHDGGAKLIDFGVSLLAGASRVTRTGEHLGTPRYMAPEQLLGAHDVDRRTDVYALGVVAYEALSGVSPFPLDHGAGALVAAVLGGAAVPLRSRRPELPAALGDVIAAAMARSRDDRFPDVLAMMTAWDVATRSVDSFAPATIAMPSSSPPGPIRSSDPGEGTGAEDAVTGRMMPKTPRIGELPGAIAALRNAAPGPTRLESPTPSPTLGAAAGPRPGATSSPPSAPAPASTPSSRPPPGPSRSDSIALAPTVMMPAQASPPPPSAHGQWLPPTLITSQPLSPTPSPIAGPHASIAAPHLPPPPIAPPAPPTPSVPASQPPPGAFVAAPPAASTAPRSRARPLLFLAIAIIALLSGVGAAIALWIALRGSV